MKKSIQPHIMCGLGDVAKYVLIPGDPRRVEVIASFLDEGCKRADYRGFVTYTGKKDGVDITICSTGIGCPSAAIAVEELGRIGADTFIRVGSCGVLQEGQAPGDVVIASGTVRMGGTGNAYLPPMYPAVPTFNVLRKLVESGEELNIPVTVGVGSAGDAFYAPYRDPNLSLANLVFVEMESDTLFIVGQVRRWRTGAIFASDGGPGNTKPESGEADFRRGEQNAIKIALGAMWKIAQEDKA